MDMIDKIMIACVCLVVLLVIADMAAELWRSWKADDEELRRIFEEPNRMRLAELELFSFMVGKMFLLYDEFDRTGRDEFLRAGSETEAELRRMLGLNAKSVGLNPERECVLNGERKIQRENRK